MTASGLVNRSSLMDDAKCRAFARQRRWPEGAQASAFACQSAWDYERKTVCHARGEDGFCKIHVNAMVGFWSLLRSWSRPHRGISQHKLQR